MIKLLYNKPVAEETESFLATNLLDASLEGNLEDYGDGGDFVW